MFLGESGKPVSHRHILIYHNNLPVLAEELTPPLRHLLSAYLNIQCSACLYKECSNVLALVGKRICVLSLNIALLQVLLRIDILTYS